MGCFNVACNLSNVSMYGDDALWVPLVKSHEQNGTNLYCYPTALFTPCGCPVFGTYNSYGSLDNIESNQNVEILEQLFGDKIEHVIADPSEYSIDGHQLNGTFISREAFEWSKKYLYDDAGNNMADGAEKEFNRITPAKLMSWDFELVKPSDDQNYPDIYVSSRYPGIECYAGTELGYCLFDGKQYHPQTVANFFALCKEITKVDPKPQWLDRPASVWATLEQMQEEIHSIPFMPTDHDEYVIWYSQLEINHLHPFRYLRHEGARFSMSQILFKAYMPFVDECVEDLANLRHLHYALFYNNKFWSPQSNGFQHGSVYQEKSMAEFVMQKAEREIKELQKERAYW